MSNSIHDYALARRELVRQFRVALEGGDTSAIASAIVRIDAHGDAWLSALRAVVRVAKVDRKVQQFFVRVWVHYGDHIRGEVGGDIVLIDALRILLPKYQGSSVQLFRGDAFLNRKHRTYGLAWSSDRTVAERFARLVGASYAGGGVLLETVCDQSSIVCSIEDWEKSGENEYLVDRRAIGRVNVLGRFAHASLQEIDAALAAEINDVPG